MPITVANYSYSYSYHTSPSYKPHAGGWTKKGPKYVSEMHLTGHATTSVEFLRIRMPEAQFPGRTLLGSSLNKPGRTLWHPISGVVGFRKPPAWYRLWSNRPVLLNCPST